ncbi:type IV toxin-antitoxin system AbiEi family antitoxin domain-containing protein [Luteipulveratus mongoliensis]|uniref:type IV toxin-antitoxin system AbiEi family antitoxin domain-containing protein n=1 Tax=Luteipulveratus mongoliensis TaxID=571913 RepID=UPI0009F9D36A|nr:type IV toxin-antitoxin system AbiEi family antitoxin domain-containing protein [Luteipulveratus mongoliensis]
MSAVLEVSDLAASQWGLLTAAQAHAAGISRMALTRMVDEGILERPRHGIYRLAGSPAHRFDSLRAAWLSLDRRPLLASERVLGSSPPAVVSHRSAALLLDMGDIDADIHEFSVATRKQTRQPDVRLHRAQLDLERWTVVDGLPVTTPVHTVVDLARGRLDGGHLATVVRDATTSHGVHPDDLAEALRPYAHYYSAPAGDGNALVARLLQEAGIPDALDRTVRLAGASAGLEELQRAVDSLQLDVPRAALEPWLAASAQLSASPALQQATSPRAIENLRRALAVLVDEQVPPAYLESLRPALKALAEQAAATAVRPR